ncbi:acetyl-CoA carboxylase biotin carboxyl carrier protein [Clostridium sp. CX1]|uniref:Biotin carboxyl carrier protein of acetyl-CoA carboxylase n=1 Tax=Clostridium tanneri TaxID=3037988 RepID=A0ABU4JUJ4_9CLOT|nr:MULTISPECIES: acetyl-CoA carboxylase biotin carboxyl carrier protein [unclassified Clostridium]MCT8977568.1 acetyl-CoA carboxylase biotin carboxyl carrier protein [Clostridium sp. CX1]MDW8801593.1 acetyl-CoA carboxylase biotin carboxyl carrier protein [Clostridium sp. A1-XYC3]
MDFKAIQDMIKTMDDSKLGYLEVNWHGISIVMRKEGEEDFSRQPIIQSKLETEEQNSPEKEIIEDKINSRRELQKEEVTEIKKEYVEDTNAKNVDENLVEVASPIVGTFYASSGPDKPPYAKVGTKVKKGDTLCIIEAMKLMNEIQSEIDGEVVEVLVENEQMVEYGQLMFKIKAQ